VSRRKWTAACPTCSWAVPEREKQEKVASPRSLYIGAFYVPHSRELTARERGTNAVDVLVTSTRGGVLRTRMRPVKSPRRGKRKERRKRPRDESGQFHTYGHASFQRIAFERSRCHVDFRGKKRDSMASSSRQRDRLYSYRRRLARMAVWKTRASR